MFRRRPHKFSYLSPVVSSFPIYTSGGACAFLVYLNRHLPPLVISSYGAHFGAADKSYFFCVLYFSIFHSGIHIIQITVIPCVWLLSPLLDCWVILLLVLLELYSLWQAHFVGAVIDFVPSYFMIEVLILIEIMTCNSSLTDLCIFS